MFITNNTPGKDFLSQLGHSADLFSAFKTHSQQSAMVAVLKDENGKLRSFSQFKKATQPITGKYNRAWLCTEYNTAISRAHHAANWQQYESEKDVLPNLEWIESTSANPGEDHQIYWGVIRPVDDPFWSEHRPGDRWNCQCSLEQTDKQPTKAINIEPGTKDNLDGNPREPRLFNDSHPYYPASCSACPFATNKLAALFHNLVADKDCHNCSAINRAIEKTETQFKVVRKYDNGGSLIIYNDIDKSKADYKPIKIIGQFFAKKGDVVVITPTIHFKSPLYKEIYKPLIETVYEGKCPDLSINGIFYEFESFIKPWNKKKVSNMISHGAKQSPYIIINNTKGSSDRFIRRAIFNRLNDKNFSYDIKEVWLYEKGEIRLLYKKQKER